MALSQKHRSSIYRTLSPLLGEEEAEALMSQFPATERDELVTRSMLLATEAALRSEIAALRGEMHQGFRRQTVWLSGMVVTGLMANAALLSLLA